MTAPVNVHPVKAARMKASGSTWTGRSLRRVEDPALLTGRGRFTADLPAAFQVRFVRSPVAAGTIVKVTAPDGASVFTAADLEAVKPIVPSLNKFGYVLVEQRVLASGVVRYVGEPIAAVVARGEAAAEDIAEDITVEIGDADAVVDARAAFADDPRLFTRMCPATSSSRARSRRRVLPPPGMRAHRACDARSALAAAERDAA